MALMNKIRLDRLLNLIKTKGIKCSYYHDSCNLCSNVMRATCQEGFGFIRSEQAELELSEIPEHELFEVLL